MLILVDPKFTELRMHTYQQRGDNVKWHCYPVRGFAYSKTLSLFLDGFTNALLQESIT